MKELYVVGEQLPNFMNAQDVANYFGVSKSVVYGLMHTEGFPLLKLGRRFLVPSKKLLKWIEENTGKYNF